MPSGQGVVDTPHGPVSFFHDSPDCLQGKEHDWSGHRYFWDHCEDPSHENLTDEEHEKVCREDYPDNPLCMSPSGQESFCVVCGMGAMHHSLMTAEE